MPLTLSQSCHAIKIARAESLISHLLIEVNKLLIRTVDNRSEKRVNSKNRHEFILKNK